MRALAPLSLGLALALTPLGCRPDRTETPAVAAPLPAAPTEPDTPSTHEVLAASDLPQLLPEPLPEDPLGVTIHRLSNGMTVYIATDRQAPSFYGWIAVRAGSRHDPADSTGLAHYLEHMLLFKGTDDLGTVDHAAEAPHLQTIRGLYRELQDAQGPQREAVLAQIDAQTQEVAKYAIPNEIGRLYTSLGFTGMNAYTNQDRTYYVQSVPANRLQTWATVEAERFGDPVFRLFFPELEAVYEEKNRGLDSSWRQMWTEAAAGLYPEHPLGTQTTLGEVEHLKTPAFDQMVAFYERWYVPNNMAILLVGDVDASALPTLEQAFGGIAPQPLEDPPPGALTLPEGRVVKEVRSRDEEMVRIGWRTVAAGHPDAAALRVLQRLLGDARTGLLDEKLEQPRKVQWASSNLVMYREAGHLTVDAARREGQSLEQVEALLRDTLAQLSEVTDEQVEAAKLQTVIEREVQREFPQSTVNRLLDTFVQHRQWKDVLAEERKLAALTRADVLDVASRYLGEDSVVVFRRFGDPDMPKVTKPDITPLQLDATAQSSMATRIAEQPAEPLQPVWVEDGEHYQRRQLPAGVLIASTLPDTDVFTLAYAWHLGYRRQRLLCEALAVHERSGTADLDPAQLQRRLYALGSTIETRCGDEQTQVFIRGLDRNFEQTLAVLDAWFQTPKIEADAIAQHVSSTLERRANELDAEDPLTSALREHAKFGPRSAWKVRPSGADLRRLSPAKAQRAVTRLFDHQHRTLYAGPRTPDAVADLVARGTKHRRVDPPKPRRYAVPETTTVFVLDRAQAKANVEVAIPGPPRDTSDPAAIPTAEVLTRYIGGGTGSITFREIRTKRSLAYAVGAWVDTGDTGEPMAYMGRMQNQSDKVAEALPTLLETMRRAQIEPGRLAEAQSALDERYRGSRVNPRFVPFTVDTWFVDGFETDPRPARYAALADVGGPEIAGLIDTLGQAPAIITIVGDASTIDLEALEREVGPIVTVEPEDLFTP